MNLWQIIKRASLQQLGELFLLALANIRLLLPTIKATRETIRLSNLHFKGQHHKHTPANAFRHALWNWLIAVECRKWTRSEQKILRWTTKITAMHEKILPGEPLANAMDHHNNAVGRVLYKRNKDLSLEKITDKLVTLTRQSAKIDSQAELTQLATDQLVHIMDTKNER